ncbi:hypothetical protein LCGC14_2047450, partial [marine sediment metagenome]
MRSLAMVFGVVFLAAPIAPAEMVTERWGSSDRCRHTGVVTFKDISGSAVMKFDLSKLAKGAKVHRARLVLPISAGPGPLARPVRIHAMMTPPSDSGWAVETKALALVAPRYRSFDATDVVRRWASGKLANHGLVVGDAPGWNRQRTYLEITYDGKLIDPPPPATGLKAFHRAGQVFLTWREVNCPFAGKDEAPWD